MKNPLVALLLIGACLFFYRGRIRDFFVPFKVSTKLTMTEQCLGKKTCTLVYLAPWCPACNSILPELSMMANLALNNPEHGVLIIVGHGQTPGENEAKAGEIGKSAIVDKTGEFARDLKIRHYPTFLVVEAGGKLRGRDQEAMAWMNETFGFAVGMGQ